MWTMGPSPFEPCQYGAAATRARHTSRRSAGARSAPESASRAVTRARPGRAAWPITRCRLSDPFTPGATPDGTRARPPARSPPHVLPPASPVDRPPYPASQFPLPALAAARRPQRNPPPALSPHPPIHTHTTQSAPPAGRGRQTGLSMPLSCPSAPAAAMTHEPREAARAAREAQLPAPPQPAARRHRTPPRRAAPPRAGGGRARRAAGRPRAALQPSRRGAPRARATHLGSPGGCNYTIPRPPVTAGGSAAMARVTHPYVNSSGPGNASPSSQQNDQRKALKCSRRGRASPPFVCTRRATRRPCLES